MGIKSYMSNKNPYLLVTLALAMGLLFHGTSIYTTLEGTYDFYVHIFFGDHYARSWFEPWEPRWYTGFALTSYPPLAHQLIGLFSLIGGLKFGAFALIFCILILYISGAYRFAKLVTSNETAAGYAALGAVFLPSVVEALHVFGQIPTMLGISWLLHSLPEIYSWVRFGKRRKLISSLSILAVAVCSHHVTPIFGMVFFVLPLMGTAVLDGARQEAGSYAKIGIPLFIKYVRKFLPRIIIFGVATIIIAVIVILPYWLWSKSDPITQVPIPHGSRDNFFEVFSSGLVFFIIPWGFLMVLLPYFFYRFFSKRNIFIGISFTLLIILGTGGSSPIPIMLLGETAFNILTLERFTFWATIWAMPLAGEFIWSFFDGPIKEKILRRNSNAVYNFLTGIMVVTIFISAGLTLNLGKFRPMQPKAIELTPLLNFINSDKHDKWRFLTLGFGDQMAWLSANTTAKTIDGNYHSARRVPELTTRAIERLENAKYKGHEGIGTLQQFLSFPDKFHLKYIFSNDKFYDPLLYFNGWHRVKKLDNGIMIWERSDIRPLPSIIRKKETPLYQKIMWGTIPLLCLSLALFFNIQLHWINHITNRNQKKDDYQNPEETRPQVHLPMYYTSKFWFFFMTLVSAYVIYRLYFINQTQNGPEKVVFSYYDALDFKYYEDAYSYLAADESYPIDQFMLETSVTDGIVDSYGKIDQIQTTILSRTDSSAIVAVHLKFITPLKAYEKDEQHRVIKKGNKWYMIPEPLEYSVPANQFVRDNYTDFHNQGRKKITTEETFHTDIVDRPVLNVLQVNLVKNDSAFFLVGYLQNVDAYPADITLVGQLLDEEDVMVAESSEGLYAKHKLLPKEITPFKIEFDPLSYIGEEPGNVCSFSLQALASVAVQDLYKEAIFTELEVEATRISGGIFNQGTQSITIPQVLVSYFDEQKNILNVDQFILEKKIDPRRSSRFELPASYAPLTLISNKPKEVLVNGLDNNYISLKYKQNRKSEIEAMPVDWPNYHYVQLTLNNFVGNPSKF